VHQKSIKSDNTQNCSGVFFSLQIISDIKEILEYLACRQAGIRGKLEFYYFGTSNKFDVFIKYRNAQRCKS
jgi:hypothetical protein